MVNVVDLAVKVLSHVPAAGQGQTRPVHASGGRRGGGQRGQGSPSLLLGAHRDDVVVVVLLLKAASIAADAAQQGGGPLLGHNSDAGPGAASGEDIADPHRHYIA